MRDGIRWFTSIKPSSPVIAPWRSLTRAAVPFADPRWYLPWAGAFAEGRPAAVCTVWDGGELTAVMPLLGGRGVLRAMANDHTPRYAVAARDEHALEAVVGAVLDRTTDALELTALATDDPVLALLERAAAGGRYRLLVEDAYTSPVVAATGDFAAYREPRRKQWREIERRRRKLLREHDVELELLARPDDLGAALDAAFAVEASGWKGEAGTAIASSPATDRFYRELAGGFAADGELRLSFLRVDGAVVAMDLALVRADGYFLLKTGYDERLRSLAPGLALRLSVIERCFEEGLRHEFLGADMEYKRLFATAERRHVTARVYRRSARGSARWAYRSSARPLMKRAYRRLVPARP